MSVELTAEATAVDCCPSPSLPEIDLEQSSEVASLARALADPIRVQILDTLRAGPGEVCQCELAPRFPISQPTLSHHLRKLHEAGLVDVERRGRWAYYSLVPGSLEGLRAWLS
jgi:ArsR family transcriptional regulator, arsenate/arsenite/antimonite-responsive transcriptional repressor